MGKGGRSSSSSGSRGIGNRNLCCQPAESDVSNHGLITIATLGSQTCSACPSVGNSPAVHDIYPCRCVLRYSCNTSPRAGLSRPVPYESHDPAPYQDARKDVRHLAHARRGHLRVEKDLVCEQLSPSMFVRISAEMRDDDDVLPRLASTSPV
jgi:hypothetical protein